MRRAARSSRFLILLAFVGCGEGGLTLGLPGCEGGAGRPFAATPENTVEHGLRFGVTAAGTDFLIEQREALVRLLFDVDDQGRARFELPAVDFGDRGGGLGVGVRDAVVRFDLRRADIALDFLPDPARIHVKIDRARLALEDAVVWVSAGGDAECRVGNGLAPGTADEALIELDLAIDLHLEIDDEGRFHGRVEVLPFTVHALDVELVHDPDLPACNDGVSDAECPLFCGAGDAAADLGEALRDALSEELDRLLRPVVQALVDRFLGPFQGQPLFVEGEVHPRLLAGLLPTAADAHPLAFRVGPSPSGFVVRAAGADDDGLELTLDTGLDAADHPCVPLLAEPPPAFDAGPPPDLDGRDRRGRVHHLALGLSEAVLNRALWVAYRAGVLCIALDSAAVEDLLGQRIDTATLALVLPGLEELTDGPRPILVALDPDFGPGDFPLVRFRPVADDGGVPQAAAAVSLPHLRISFYALVEERWTRVFAGRADVALDLTLSATPDDRIAVAVATPSVSGLTEDYNELLAGADIAGLLELVVDLATAALLRDGLSLDFGLDGVVTRLTGLPLDLRVAALEIGGPAGDYLNALLSLEQAAPGQGVVAAVDTRAALTGFDPEAGAARLAVEAVGADEARFQWRVDRGPWRPFHAAPDGTLRLHEPRLALLGPHTIAVRAVARGEYRSLDPTPAVVSLETRRPPATLPASRAPAGGCAAAPGAGAPWWAFLVLLGLGARRGSAAARSRPPRSLRLGALAPRRAPPVAGAVALALLGCGDRRSAADPPCDETADCPGGYVCAGGACVVPAACEETAECCPGAVCKGGACEDAPVECAADGDCAGSLTLCDEGLCVRRPCDGGCPAGARCVAGYCHAEPPCQGRCGEDEACFPHRDACRRAPPSCAESCGPGFLRVVADASAFRGAACALDGATCECVRSPALVPADYGRHASMGLLDGEPVFAAYDADFGDLVFVEGVADDRPRVTYVDGVPPEAPVRADPGGPRGGRTAPGPDRGRYASLAVDLKGRPHIAYYDADAGALRYVRADEDGRWGEPLVVDDDGDVGRYARLVIDTAGRPHVVYYAARMPDGRTALKYASSASPSPGPGDFVVRLVSAGPLPTGEAAPPPPGVTPAGHGVRPCLRAGRDGRLYVGFYDGEERWLYLGRGGPDGFEVHRLAGEPGERFPPDPGRRYERFVTHDVGRFCSLDVAVDGTVHVAFTDADTQALLYYRGPVTGGGEIEVIDDGARPDIRRRVGADPSLALAPDGRVVVVYQDATMNDLLMSVRTPAGWSERPLELLPGGAATGFYNSLIVLDATTTVVGTAELGTTDGGRAAHRLYAFRQDIPRF